MIDTDLPDPLVAKLRRFCDLGDNDTESLRQLKTAPPLSLGPREDLVVEGDTPMHVSLVLRGWACRYKQLDSGRRQILGYLLPGDMTDLEPYSLRRMDHSIASIASTTVAQIPRDTMISLTGHGSQVARALWCSSLAAQAIEREWIVNIGQRTALERIGHLLCELFVRLDAIGLTSGMSFLVPLTQVELADSTGLSVVHVNRTLQELRARKLLSVDGRAFTIQDWARLEKLSHFTPNYLHLNERDSDRFVSPSDLSLT